MNYTKDQLLKQALKRRSPGVSEQSIRIASDRYAPKRILFYESDISDLLRLAGRIDTSHATEKKNKDQKSITKIDDPQPDAPFLDSLEREIEEMRKHLFNSTAIPFDDNEKARQWIERTGQDELSLEYAARVNPQSAKTLAAVLNLARSKKYKTAQKLHSQMDQYYKVGASDSERLDQLRDHTSKIQALGFSVQVKKVLLPYPWDGWVVNQPGGATGKIAFLNSRVTEFSDKQSFRPASVTWWILRGIRPIVPKIEIHDESIYEPDPEETKVAGEFRVKTKRFRLKICINSLDVSIKDLFQIYKLIQNSRFDVSSRKRKEMHLRIETLVIQKGVPEQFGKKKPLWESIRLQLKKEGYNPGKTWQGIRKAYYQMIQPKQKATMKEWFEIHDRENQYPPKNKKGVKKR